MPSAEFFLVLTSADEVLITNGKIQFKFSAHVGKSKVLCPVARTFINDTVRIDG